MNAGGRRLRVLHIGKYYPPHRGGMESFLADLVDQQRASGIEARAIVHGDPQPHDPPWIIRVPVQITLVFAPIALGFPLALWRALRRFKPDVIHLHMPNNAAFWALVVPGARRVPWVVHWHSDVLISRWDWLLSACYQLYRPFEYKLLQASEAILATSPPYMAASQPLQRWLYKTIAVPLGLKPLAQEHAASAAHASAAAWGDAALRVLSVGRLTYYKGFDTLISAVAGYPQVRLLIAGEGEQRAMLQDLIAQERAAQGCANVQLLGAVSEEEKHALFNSCDVFALASRERTEAFGLVLVEAMQHGKPCIVSDLEGSGMSWVVSQAGGGRCYAPEQVQAWKRAIEQCMASKSQLMAMGQSAKAAAQSRFTIAQCAQRIDHLYREISGVPRRLMAPAGHEAGPAGHRLRVLMAFSPADWSEPAAAAHERAQTVVVNATGLRRPPGPRGLMAIDLEPGLDLADALEVVKLLALEQGAAGVCIRPMRAGAAAAPFSPAKPRRSWLQHAAAWFRRQGVDLRRDSLELEGPALQQWLQAPVQVLGSCLLLRRSAGLSSQEYRAAAR